MTMPDDMGSEPRSERWPRRPRADLDELAGEDLGLVCHACFAVTIFSPEARHPRRCARCARVIARRPGPDDGDRITIPPASA